MEYNQLVVFGIALILFSLWKWSRKAPNFPPGPIGLPVVGYLPFLGEYPHKTFNELAKKYGSVFSVRLGNTDVVVLNDWKAVKEALINQSDIFNGRPKSIIYEEIFHTADIAFNEGQVWKDRRRFALHFLRDYGFGKSTMEDLIRDEIQVLSDRLKLDCDKEIHPSSYFSTYLLNVTWTIVAKRRFDHDNVFMTDYMAFMKEIFGNLGLSNTNILVFMPYLRFVYRKQYKKLQKSVEEIYEFLRKTVDDHVVSYQEGSPRDFIDSYLGEIYRREKTQTQTEAFTKESLIQISHNIFLGGIDTSNNTLEWGLLYLAIWPTIQKKVQQELDDVIGRQRLPTWNDRSVLKYTTAFIMELNRYISLVPLSVTHSTMSATRVYGYSLPKDTFVFPNLWAVHHDPNYWEDPEVFRPERFFDQNGDLEKPEYLIPFSVGGRICPGKSMAEMNIFLLISCLLHQFTFTFPPGKPLPSLCPNYALTLSPEPFSLLVSQR